MYNNENNYLSQHPKKSFFDNSWQKELFPNKQPAQKISNLGNLPYLTRLYNITFYSNICTITSGTSSRPPHEMPERKKNDITKFSANSRRRLIHLLSKINLLKYNNPLFVTLTFHNVYPKDSERLKKIFRNFLKVLRKRNKNFHIIWRIEWQKRGAPHFHLIYLPIISAEKYNYNLTVKNIKRSWWRYIEDFGISAYLHSVDVVAMQEKKQVFAYISKYTAKIEDESENSYRGQRWGHSENLHLDPQMLFALDLKFLSFLKKKFWKVLSKKINNTEDYNKAFFDNGQISFLMDFYEATNIFDEAIKEFQLLPT